MRTDAATIRMFKDCVKRAKECGLVVQEEGGAFEIYNSDGGELQIGGTSLGEVSSFIEGYARATPPHA